MYRYIGSRRNNLLRHCRRMIDSTPIICIMVRYSHLLGSDAFQETDIIGISTPVTKWSYQIRVEEIPDIIAKAFYIARSGRPGPVLIAY